MGLDHIPDDTGYDFEADLRQPYQNFKDELAAYEMELEPEEIQSDLKSPFQISKGNNWML